MEPTTRNERNDRKYNMYLESNYSSGLSGDGVQTFQTTGVTARVSGRHQRLGLGCRS